MPQSPSRCDSSVRTPTEGFECNRQLARRCYILWPMMEPSLKVIGVYRPVISAKTRREQYQVTGDERITREHFGKLVLIEAVAEGVGQLDFSKFGQMLSGYRDYPDNMQV